VWSVSCRVNYYACACVGREGGREGGRKGGRDYGCDTP